MYFNLIIYTVGCATIKSAGSIAKQSVYIAAR